MTEIMQGYPVPVEWRIPRQDWDRAPWNRWSFQNVRQVLPTTEVWRGNGPVWRLNHNFIDLSLLPFSNDDGLATIQDWLNYSFTDGFVVLHRGQIVCEQYQNNMTERTLHLSQSMAKSVVGCVAGILIGRGDMNVDQRVSHYLPELEATAWKGATLRQVLDMTTGVRYIEDYTALDSDIAMTDIASGWKHAAAGVVAPACMWDQILGLTESVREHGEKFEYRSIETDVLGHCLERVTHTRLAELVSRELWQHLGCEESASFTVDPVGYAMADGGFNATLRDYARFGQMLLQNGHANGRQIVPKDWIKDIHKADHRIFGEPYTTTAPNGGYRNQFWVQDVNKKAFMARGVFGQLIYVDPENDMVITKLSSWPEFTSVPRLKTALKAINAIGKCLNKN
ncbi:MAG: CubicO group peptidase (beta-lactamase class C family) [Planctomycetota bacterium]|jgi:CubicO group peptidase (beta-lactamase class C family)